MDPGWSCSSHYLHTSPSEQSQEGVPLTLAHHHCQCSDGNKPAEVDRLPSDHSSHGTGTFPRRRAGPGTLLLGLEDSGQGFPPEVLPPSVALSVFGELAPAYTF